MRCTLGLMAVVVWTSAAACGDADELLASAIKATADKPEKLEKLKNFTSKAAGEMFGRKTSREITMGWPSTFRLNTEFEEGGEKAKVQVLIHEGSGWTRVVGQPAKPMLPQDVADQTDDLISIYWMATLFPLQQKGVILKKVDDVKLPGGVANGIRVSRPNKPDALVYFDGKTHLLAKIAMIGKERGVRVLRELEFSDYRAVDGIKLPFEEIESHNGQKVNSWKVSEIKLVDKLDPAILKP